MMAKEDYKLVFSGEQSASVMAYLYTSVANGNSQDCSKQDYNFSIRRGCGPLCSPWAKFHDVII